MSEVASGRFLARLAHLRGRLEAWLDPWLAARVEEAKTRGDAVQAVAAAVSDLVLRGGKRVRAGLLATAYEACAGGDGDAVVAAGAGLELLHAYFLVHDDWMDGDDERRGAPSVPAVMRARFPGQDDATSVLAGDLASAWAHRALFEVALPAERVIDAARELARAHEQVVAGQVLDVCAECRTLERSESAKPRQTREAWPRCAPEACHSDTETRRDEAEVERVYALKTASYTVRAPVVMGAKLAGAAASQSGALAAYAEPVGVAFQLRDDLLGVFGDASVTGKPSGNDLRRGKRTSLLIHALQDARAAQAIGRVLGRADASDADVAAAVEAIEASGAKARIEERIAALVVDSRAALGRAELTAAGRELLEDAAVALTRRER
jgi:geranylgeranyl diphosphate synthase type I